MRDEAHRVLKAINALILASWALGVPQLGFSESATTLPSFVKGTSMAFVYPVMGPRTSSDFGKRRHPLRRVRQHHDGIDLAAPVGAPIRAIADGQVMFSDPHGGYGKYIVIEHASGYTSHYGHCDTLTVAPGEKVSAGQIVGTVGSTGLSTGPHLHFEIRHRGVAQNPERYLPGLDERGAG